MQELHELEEELHTEILPGTEIMRDIGTHHFVKAGSGLNNVLVPQPSDDPADPLNWSLKWKLSTIVTSNFVTFFMVCISPDCSQVECIDESRDLARCRSRPCLRITSRSGIALWQMRSNLRACVSWFWVSATSSGMISPGYAIDVEQHGF